MQNRFQPETAPISELSPDILCTAAADGSAMSRILKAAVTGRRNLPQSVEVTS